MTENLLEQKTKRKLPSVQKMRKALTGSKSPETLKAFERMVDAVLAYRPKAKGKPGQSAVRQTGVTTMAEFKGTAGEWHYDDEKMLVLAGVAVSPGCNEVAMVVPAINFGEDSANGRLLGASKDLLAALQAYVHWDEQVGDNMEESEMHQNARAALAKATKS